MQEKTNAIQIGKEKVEYLLFAYNMTTYTTNLKTITIR
jgi:hypothetical protein